MPMLHSARTAALLGALLLASACRTSNDPAADLSPTGSARAAQTSSAGYCPQVTLREGTGVLREGEGESLRYTASIASTTRECAVVDGRLTMQVAVSGSVTPGLAAEAGAASLPVRVAVVQGDSVLYSALGRQEVAVEPAGGPSEFIYVDRAVSFPVPSEQNIVIYAGFDEMG